MNVRYSLPIGILVGLCIFAVLKGKPERRYYITFNYGSSNVHGVGYQIVDTKLKFNTQKEILDLTNYLKTTNTNFTELVILNWKQISK